MKIGQAKASDQAAEAAESLGAEGVLDEDGLDEDLDFAPAPDQLAPERAA
jgi:hypothetical protein